MLEIVRITYERDKRKLFFRPQKLGSLPDKYTKQRAIPATVIFRQAQPAWIYTRNRADSRKV